MIRGCVVSQNQLNIWHGSYTNATDPIETAILEWWLHQAILPTFSDVSIVQQEIPLQPLLQLQCKWCWWHCTPLTLARTPETKRSSPLTKALSHNRNHQLYVKIFPSISLLLISMTHASIAVLPLQLSLELCWQFHHFKASLCINTDCVHKSLLANVI